MTHPPYGLKKTSTTTSCLSQFLPLFSVTFSLLVSFKKHTYYLCHILTYLAYPSVILLFTGQNCNRHNMMLSARRTALALRGVASPLGTRGAVYIDSYLSISWAMFTAWKCCTLILMLEFFFKACSMYALCTALHVPPRALQCTPTESCVCPLLPIAMGQHASPKALHSSRGLDRLIVSRVGSCQGEV